MKYVVWVLLLACRPAQAQYYFYNEKYLDQPLLGEISAGAGWMNCFTDLGKGSEQGRGWRQLDWQGFRPTVNLGISLNWKQQLGLRFELGQGMVTAADSVLKGITGNAAFRYQRNLHFRSRIREALLLVQLYPIHLLNPGQSGKWAPYLLAGIGIFQFGPQARLSGIWTDLTPLRTEGEGAETWYACTQLNFPAGAGLRYELSALASLSLECNYRFLKTDYLDDVSTFFIDPASSKRPPAQEALLKELYGLSRNSPGRMVLYPGAVRGNPESRDSYFTVTLRAAWILNRYRLDRLR